MCSIECDSIVDTGNDGFIYNFNSIITVLELAFWKYFFKVKQ